LLVTRQVDRIVYKFARLKNKRDSRITLRMKINFSAKISHNDYMMFSYFCFPSWQVTASKRNNNYSAKRNLSHIILLRPADLIVFFYVTRSHAALERGK